MNAYRISVSVSFSYEYDTKDQKKAVDESLNSLTALCRMLAESIPALLEKDGDPISVGESRTRIDSHDAYVYPRYEYTTKIGWSLFCSSLRILSAVSMIVAGQLELLVALFTDVVCKKECLLLEN